MTTDDTSEGASAADLATSYGDALQRQDWTADAAPLGDVDAARNEHAPPPLARIVEALLFVGGAPLTPERACAAVRGLTPEQLTPLIDGLNRDYREQGRPYRVLHRAHGYEMALLPRFRPVLDRLFGSTREARLSPVTLAVLALVAYRQPATKQEVDSLRGVESGAALRSLVRLGLISLQRGEAGQREVSYSTTARFLSLFKLRNLDDLPRTQELQTL
jgi:segregation and condensation protein B